MRHRIGHEMIKASAGSGKTHALVNRYLKLLAMGENPTRITALTFTRKAAGEFLQKIFLRLTEVSASDEAAARLCREIKIGVRDSSYFISLLDDLVREIGRLQLGTIDHFFARVVGAFPFELGLTRPHRIMDDFEQERARSHTLEQLIEFSSSDLDQLILQLYKNLTWGAEEKNVYKLFDERLKDYHQQFVETGEPDPWGDQQAMYKTEPWWSSAPDNKETLTKETLRELRNAGFDERTMASFESIILVFKNWQAGQDPKFSALFNRILESRDELLSGMASIKFNRKQLDIPVSLGELFHGMLQIYVGSEIKRKLLITRSTGGLLDLYDKRYSQLIRETGSLVFADFPILLVKALEQDASILSAEDLLYRLDTMTDHWLIDEFQDTSRIQWKVLSPFVDEVLQDTEGRRSFFYVGDVKQSIYAWRGGDARLFDEIFNYYHRNGSGINASTRQESWRSGPAVLDCVNQLFGPGLAASGIPFAVLERWKNNWEPHVVSPKTKDLECYSGWGFVDEATTIGSACAEVIREVNPLERGLTCAVLVRQNDEVQEVTQVLREAGIPSSMEARIHIVEDNVVGSWIRAFLYSIVRPGEKFPRKYLEACGVQMDSRRYGILVRDFRKALTNEGHAEALRVLLEFLEELVSGNPFLVRRSEQILEVATRFGNSGQDSLEAFIKYLETSTVEESTLNSQVQVMTVHKAKGLDFDMVLVAGFGKQEVCRNRGSSLHVERDVSGEVQWILDMPRKDIVCADSCLERARSDEEANEVFEALCLLYVAMTRARQGLYCLAFPYEKKGNSLRWHHLFSGAFSGKGEERMVGSIAWQCEWGKADWYASESREVEKPSVVKLKKLKSSMEVTPFLRLKASPSREAHATKMEVHPLRSARGKRFGTRMHNFLATLDWISFEDKASLEQLVESVDADLKERFSAFIKGPSAREVFEKPKVSCVLWREKPYALREGNILTQGIIDRAHVSVDEKGNPVHVQIYDFKTDQLDPKRPAQAQLMERYSVQMERYVEAVVILTGLAPENVSTELIPV